MVFDAFDLDTLDREARYKMLTGAVVPRPIACVTTLSPGGGVNVAPFSQFVIVAVDPGLLGISIGPRAEGCKDTLANIEASGEFVINIVSDAWARTVQACAQDFAPEASEAEALGLDTVASQTIRPPRLGGAAIQFECVLEQIARFGSAPNHFVVGRVTRMHARTGLVTDFKVDARALAPLSRIGGRNYARLGDIIEV